MTIVDWMGAELYLEAERTGSGGGQGKEDEEDEESLSKCRRVQEKQLVMLVFRSAKL